MPHPLVIAMFPELPQVASAARELHAAGVSPDRLSIISRNHDEESDYAAQIGGTPGAEIEDSRTAARLASSRDTSLPPLRWCSPASARSLPPARWPLASVRPPA